MMKGAGMSQTVRQPRFTTRRSADLALAGYSVVTGLLAVGAGALLGELGGGIREIRLLLSIAAFIAVTVLAAFAADSVLDRLRSLAKRESAWPEPD